MLTTETLERPAVKLGPRACPKCEGYVYVEAGEAICANCGRRQYVGQLPAWLKRSWQVNR